MIHKYAARARQNQERSFVIYVLPGLDQRPDWEAALRYEGGIPEGSDLATSCAQDSRSIQDRFGGLLPGVGTSRPGSALPPPEQQM